jgi:hypothetical protein
MQKSKIIPFRILNNEHSSEAKLMVTHRKETRIMIKSKSNRVKLPLTPGRSEFLLTQPGSFTDSSRPITEFSLRQKPDLWKSREFTEEQLNNLKNNSAKSADNLIRLKSLHWEKKPVIAEQSPNTISRVSGPQEVIILSPAIIPKIYSLRPFLMPFLTDLKSTEAPVQIKTPSNDKRVYWTLKETWGDRPNGREGCQLVIVSGVVYIFGGQSRIKHSEVRSLDVNIWTWRLMPTTYTPPGRLGHSLVPYKGKIVLYGGQSQHSQNLGIRRCSRKISYLSTANKTWQHYSGEGEKPEGRRHHAASHVGRFMVIYGGLNQQGHTLNDLCILDMKMKKWMLPEVIVQNDPGPRSHSSLTGIFDQAVRENYSEAMFKIVGSKGKVEFINSGFYLFGGRNAEGVVLNSLHGLYMREGKLVWTLIQNFTGDPPSPRYAHAASSIKNRLFVFGGRNDDFFRESGDSSLSDLYCFNVSSLSWECLKICGSIPGGRWAHCMISVQNKILMLGGLTTKHFMPADLYILESEREMILEPKDEAKVPELVVQNSEKNQKKNRFSLLDLLKVKNS